MESTYILINDANNYSLINDDYILLRCFEPKKQEMVSEPK